MLFERLPIPTLFESDRYPLSDTEETATTTESSTESNTLSSLSLSRSLEDNTSPYPTTMTSELETTTSMIADEDLATTSAVVGPMAASSAAEAAPTYLTLALVCFLIVLFILSEADCFGRRRQFRRKVEAALSRVQSLVSKWEDLSDEREKMMAEEAEDIELTRTIREELAGSANIMKEYRKSSEEVMHSIGFRLTQVESAVTTVVDTLMAKDAKDERQKEEEKKFKVRQTKYTN